MGQKIQAIANIFKNKVLWKRTLITMAVIGLGHTLGLKVVAEGVEDSDMADLLRGAQCDELQGFLFGRPMPADQLLVWLASQQTTEAAASPAPALMPAGAGIATD